MITVIRNKFNIKYTPKADNFINYEKKKKRRKGKETWNNIIIYMFKNVNW